jgi:uncharacterized membrane protein YeiB
VVDTWVSAWAVIELLTTILTSLMVFMLNNTSSVQTQHQKTSCQNQRVMWNEEEQNVLLDGPGLYWFLVLQVRDDSLYPIAIPWLLYRTIYGVMALTRKYTTLVQCIFMDETTFHNGEHHKLLLEFTNQLLWK